MINNYIVRFETWTLGPFRQALFGAAATGIPDAVELTSSLLPWITELQSLAEAGHLKAIQSAQATKLRRVLNQALDALEMEYRQCEASPAIMMLALSPLDDMLVFLSLRTRHV